jgi:hypothetical protein
MDSPSLITPRRPTLSRREGEAGDVSHPGGQTGRAAQEDVVLIAGFGNAIAVDLAAFVSQGAESHVIVVDDESNCRLVVPPVRSLPLVEGVRSTPDLRGEPGGVASLILFIDSRLTVSERRVLEDLLQSARRWRTRFVGIISTFRFHLDDPGVEELEDHILARASSLPADIVVFRPGHVLSPHSRVSRLLERFAAWYPLVPGHLCSCLIEATTFFAAVEATRREVLRRSDPDRGPSRSDQTDHANSAGRAVGGKTRSYTLLGPNLAWRDLLARRCATGPGQLLPRAVCALLSWLLLGHLIALVLTSLARRIPALRQWHVHTLYPRSLRELLSLCHRHNIDNVKVVGYNNGVVHFGHRHPGKTVISTIRCHRTAHAGRQALKADCGATVREALDFLAGNRQELYVIPNYSYVCLGTSFFVPIHGSAVDFSTVADTIYRVVLYDPDRDRIISAARDDASFREHVYNQQSRVVALRLYLLAKPKSRYFVDRETLFNPSAGDLLRALRDREATNVEIRQSRSASSKVTVARYYADSGNASPLALELPRDALGRLWDRLEENPLTSYLMHTLTKHFIWHTELFLRPQEFDSFWRTHAQLPLRKLQLRYIRRDGLPHSPFRDEERVSIDLFLFRRHKARFAEYLETHVPAVRSNPGKNSY